MKNLYTLLSRKTDPKARVLGVNDPGCNLILETREYYRRVHFNTYNTLESNKIYIITRKNNYMLYYPVDPHLKYNILQMIEFGKHASIIAML